MMKTELDVLPPLKRAALFAAMACLPVALLCLDIHHLDAGAGSWAVLALVGKGVLLASVLAFLRLGWVSAEDRSAAGLVAGVLASLLVRESGALQGLPFQGGWQLIVAAIVLVCLGHTLSYLSTTAHGMARLLASRSGTMLLVGLILLLLAMVAPTHDVLLAGDPLVSGRVIGQGGALLADGVILAASLAYVAQRLRAQVSEAIENAFSAPATPGGHRL